MGIQVSYFQSDHIFQQILNKYEQPKTLVIKDKGKGCCKKSRWPG